MTVLQRGGRKRGLAAVLAVICLTARPAPAGEGEAQHEAARALAPPGEYLLLTPAGPQVIKKQWWWPLIGTLGHAPNDSGEYLLLTPAGPEVIKRQWWWPLIDTLGGADAGPVIRPRR